MEIIIFVVSIAFPSKKSLSIFITIILPPVASTGFPPHLQFLELDEGKKWHLKLISLNVPRDLIKKIWFERVIPGSPAEKVGLPPVD
jgi:hypothetical protein